MGWFKKLIGLEKAADNILDKDNGLLSQAGGWLNNLSYTEQEKAEDTKALRKGITDFALATMNENSERSKTRRAIAVLWIRLQVLIILLTCVWIPIDSEIAKQYFMLATSTLMITVTTAICIFFFGSHGLAKYQESQNKSN